MASSRSHLRGRTEHYARQPESRRAHVQCPEFIRWGSCRLLSQSDSGGDRGLKSPTEKETSSTSKNCLGHADTSTSGRVTRVGSHLQQRFGEGEYSNFGSTNSDQSTERIQLICRKSFCTVSCGTAIFGRLYPIFCGGFYTHPKFEQTPPAVTLDPEKTADENAWKRIKVYSHFHPGTGRSAERLETALGETAIFVRLRRVVAVKIPPLFIPQRFFLSVRSL